MTSENEILPSAVLIPISMLTIFLSVFRDNLIILMSPTMSPCKLTKLLFQCKQTICKQSLSNFKFSSLPLVLQTYSSLVEYNSQFSTLSNTVCTPCFGSTSWKMLTQAVSVYSFNLVCLCASYD